LIIGMEGRFGRPLKPKNAAAQQFTGSGRRTQGETTMAAFSTSNFDRFATTVGNLAMLAALPFAAFAIFAHAV
jgi:hypothetical protein